jgi:hypothetical protein
MTSSASAYIAGASRKSTPQYASSYGEMPRPTPSSKRPPLIWSSIAISSMRRSGV